MKKVYLVLLIIFIILFLNFSTAYAAATELSFLGSESVEINTSNKITVKLESSKEVGIISGVLEKSSNVSEMNVEGKNNWNLTYNEETGEFNIYKAQGSKNDEIMEINYTVKDEGTAEFKLSNLKAADITYTEEELESIEMQIDVSKKQSQDKNTTNTQNTQNNTSNTSKDNTTNTSNNTNTSKSNTTNTNSSDNTSNTSKNTTNSDNLSKQKNTNTKNISNKNEDGKITPKVENAKTERKELPFTGIMGVLIPVLVVILGISGVAGYYGYRKYRGI